MKKLAVVIAIAIALLLTSLSVWLYLRSLTPSDQPAPLQNEAASQS